MIKLLLHVYQNSSKLESSQEIQTEFKESNIGPDAEHLTGDWHKHQLVEDTQLESHKDLAQFTDHDSISGSQEEHYHCTCECIQSHDIK